MILGKINTQREAIGTVFILDSVGDGQPIEAVIDAGFTGSLTLPAKYIEDLDLRLMGQRTAMLADGQRVNLNSYEATVNWHTGFKDIAVIETEGGSAHWMKLLEGSRELVHHDEGGSYDASPPKSPIVDLVEQHEYDSCR